MMKEKKLVKLSNLLTNFNMKYAKVANMACKGVEDKDFASCVR